MTARARVTDAPQREAMRIARRRRRILAEQQHFHLGVKAREVAPAAFEQALEGAIFALLGLATAVRFVAAGEVYFPTTMSRTKRPDAIGREARHERQRC